MHILKTVQNGKNWCTRPLKLFRMSVIGIVHQTSFTVKMFMTTYNKLRCIKNDTIAAS